jgi:hypothetical protein
MRYYKKAAYVPTDDDIRTEAYLMWEESGKPSGSPDFFWNMAKKKLSGGCSKKEEPDPEKYNMVMDLIRSSGADAWNNNALRNLAASVGINMDRL